MNVEEKYTTQAKITADTTGEEIKKIPLSNDAYALCEFLEFLIKKIEKIRMRMK